MLSGLFYIGYIIALAAPSTIHQRLIGNLFFAIKSFINENKGKYDPLVSPFDVMLDNGTVVQPDITVICDPDYIGKLELYRRS